MSRRIASVGYAVQLPNLFYRDGGPSFDPGTLASGWLDPKMLALNDGLSMAMTASDCGALLSHADRDTAIRMPAAVIGHPHGGDTRSPPPPRIPIGSARWRRCTAGGWCRTATVRLTG